MQTTITGLAFINAQEMREQNPRTFEAPTYEELQALKIGDNVKVCLNDERFWTIIKNIEGDAITASVDNDLVLPANKSLTFGTLITFHKHHIYSTVVP